MFEGQHIIVAQCMPSGLGTQEWRVVRSSYVVYKLSMAHVKPNFQQRTGSTQRDITFCSAPQHNPLQYIAHHWKLLREKPTMSQTIADSTDVAYILGVLEHSSSLL